MIFLIPIAMWLSTAICYLTIFKGTRQTFRRSLLTAAIANFFFIAASTELLGALDLITDWAVQGSWFLLDLALAATYFRITKRVGSNFRKIVSYWLISSKTFFKELGAFTTILLLILSCITLTVAVMTTPNNLDSLSYHLSRLGYWVQNKNVAHYATHIERSISFSPFSEYVHLHTFLLAGSWRFFQLLQWLCLVGILGFVSMLVQLFSNSRSALRIALLFAGTLPIAILESMTTQNDIVVSFFILATAFFVFDYIKKQDPVSLFLLVPTVGLGMMTKGTFAFFVLPFGLFLLIFMVSKGLWKPLGGAAVAAVFVMILLNGPFWYRTYQVFGTPIGRMSQGNKTHFSGGGSYLSSVSKHVFLHLGFISPGDRYNHFLETQLDHFHHLIGAPLNDPGTGMAFKMNRLNFNEDFAHNFLSAWLVIFSIPLLFVARISRAIKIYLALTLLAFLTFCFFIAYQTYGSRLHIPFFLLYSPVIGVVYGALFSTLFSKVLILILWLAALPFALLSASHPLLSTKWFFEEVFPPINSALNLHINIEGNVNLKQRSALMISPLEAFWGEYWRDAEKVRAEVNALHPQKIGFDFEEHSYDYAYQYLLQKPGRTFGHVAVRNPSKILEKSNFQPDIILAEHYEGEKFSYHRKVYFARRIVDGKWLYIPLQ
ncbi:ArnT family glycosyltransferase [Dyadobacter luticola]|uniref:Glycosyltransferase family 39 protein n=1 Tax=Dyadobacter luticola TaxID=1979387 RepID=A0A5R9KQ02_9BACT|nr:glycosyltransferase family 39 protein [Dyadobacter luticola]TLU98229.1 glycosyltransferase family 39 protein [Dyadobacter luticola]